MRPIRIYPPTLPITGRVTLPHSKSIANRFLIINSLIDKDRSLKGLSESGDTLLLENILGNLGSEIDAGNSGTVFRFLTAYLATQKGSWKISGSERMKNRPIGPLVESLHKLGADVTYVGRTGFPPLLINGKSLEGGVVNLDASLSSQFVTALMLIGPRMKNGLTIVLDCEPASKPYIQMTIDVMRKFGAKVEWHGDTIYVGRSDYSFKDFHPERDWSSSAFFFEICALSENAKIELSGLAKDSIQGDSLIENIMKSFSVHTSFEKEGIKIRRVGYIKKDNIFRIDCHDIPDLVPALVCSCAGLGLEAEFSGIYTLQIKESNRILALQSELNKFGLKSHYNSDDDILYLEKGQLNPFDGLLNTYDDHRIAMSLAPLSLVCGSIIIDDADVVSKSFPSFWERLIGLGFKIEAY